MKKAANNYEFLDAEKYKKSKEAGLERTHKSLKMMNFGTTKVDYILWIEKVSSDPTWTWQRMWKLNIQNNVCEGDAYSKTLDYAR